ncbi:DUF4139 domain-containing protein [Flavobacterium sp.]|uniref:DUF4139 domain-containing protein n=1 Tax=Flavobacterium sp. TaxID=239 RepID=UPI003D134418
MKKIFSFFLALISFFAFSNEIKIKSSIKEVIVYTSGAQVYAESTTTIPKGNSVVRITDLSKYINQNTIQISGLKDISVLSVGYEVVFYPKKNTSDKIASLQNEIDLKTREAVLLESKIKGLEEEESILTQNKVLSSAQQTVTMEKILIHSKHYRERIPLLKMEIFDISKKIAELKKELSAMHLEMAKFDKEEKEQKGEIILKLFNPNEAAQLNLNIKYNTENAGWVPSYEIKAKNTKDALQFAYKAQVYQTTGEDWNNVKLTLSTANPNTNNEKPIVNSHYLNFTNYNNNQNYSYTPKNYSYNPLVKTVTGVVSDSSGPLPGANVYIRGTNKGVSTGFNGSYSISIENGQELVYSFLGMKEEILPVYNSVMNVTLKDDAKNLQEVVVTAYNVKKNKNKVEEEDDEPEVKNKITEEKEVIINAVLFKINKNYTIPTNETPSLIEIDNFSIPAEFEYFTAPILSENVFLTAKIKNWAKYDLLPGEASIYTEGSYAGRAFLNPYQTEEEMIISMGIDNNLLVERKQIKDLKSKSFFGSTRVLNKNYEISVRNNKSIEVAVKIYDRVPVAQNKEIKVESIALDNAEYNEETGILNWKSSIPSKGLVKKHLSFEIKYPRDKKINF